MNYIGQIGYFYSVQFFTVSEFYKVQIEIRFRNTKDNKLMTINTALKKYITIPILALLYSSKPKCIKCNFTIAKNNFSLDQIYVKLSMDNFVIDIAIMISQNKQYHCD